MKDVKYYVFQMDDNVFKCLSERRDLKELDFKNFKIMP